MGCSAFSAAMNRKPHRLVLREDRRCRAMVFPSASELFNWAHAGMRDAATLLRPHIRWQGPTGWDASVQARTTAQLIARQIDGMALAAGVFGAMRLPLAEQGALVQIALVIEFAGVIYGEYSILNT